MIRSDLYIQTLLFLEQYKNVNVNSHWDKFKLQFDEVSVDQQEQVIVKRGWSPWMKLVAAAVLLLVGIFSYVNFDQWMGYEVKLYGTAKQERILLPDSSVMILYAGGEAIFNKKTFNEKRVVDLKKGKAFFDVKHEVNYPFVVNLANNLCARYRNFF
ncbi:Uncharacterised protein [Sphingobacterium spiritivorum]|uniref:Uncharacterized protein n=1 Tax=Sphingobacterium spiritivorum TaxID=258 RepID=A0A380CPK3_SPHSI|nr:FecR domain-containing protein [Sphingobacterium spiritivorum]SUJ24392.1 Uncharacterised protein [Sphingobacterium spiritivorum]